MPLSGASLSEPDLGPYSGCGLCHNDGAGVGVNSVPP